MKLSIDDLMVDSYAIQLCEQELTEIKGGTTLPCAGYVLVGTIITTIGYVWGSYNNKAKTPKKKVQSVSTYKNKSGGDSTVTTTTYTYY
jgi:hypothetical protein